VLVDDPLGDGVGVAAAEMLAGQGAEVVLVTRDPVVAKETPDPVGAHVRLRRAGVRVVAHAAVVAVEPGRAVLRDVDTGVRTTVACGTVVDAGPRRASEPLGVDRPGLVRAGDAVAPRTVHEAVREGRRAAEALS
jgi:2,4-dienoyl-CoA reductase (NADPH2)